METNPVESKDKQDAILIYNYKEKKKDERTCVGISKLKRTQWDGT